jgi:hypothetical protein
MTNPRAKAVARAGVTIGYRINCPGCDRPHVLYTALEGMPAWGFNGDLNRPTFTPSLHCKWNEGEARVAKVCHSFITDGRIQFLNDCTHALVGQTVDLPELEPIAYDAD